MKPPTEADLIELENIILAGWQARQYEREDNQDPKIFRVVSTLEYLIARARFHNARQLQRISVSKPAPTVQPNTEKESR
jgi:hypothetical protein